MILPSSYKTSETKAGIKKYFIIGSILFFGSSFKFFKTCDVETLIEWDWLLTIRFIGLILLLRWLISFRDNIVSEKWIIRSHEKNKDNEEK